MFAMTNCSPANWMKCASDEASDETKEQVLATGENAVFIIK